VAVTGEKIEAIQALEGSERVWQGSAHVDLDLGENLTEQGETPRALEAFEKSGSEDLGFVAIRQMLKKIPAALHQAQATPDAGLEPKRVRKGRAVSAGPGKVEKPAKRFEELDTNDCFTERLVRHKFFPKLTAL
jgi:hypothetical protein